MRFRDSLTSGLGARILGATAALIGSIWLLVWVTGIAPRWAAEGMIIVKTNMALGLVLAGTALVSLCPASGKPGRERLGIFAATIVFLVGALTLSQHLFGYNLGIDQLLAREPAGAGGTASPNRMGPPGSTSLMVLGAGLLLLASRKSEFAPWLGLATCVLNSIPAVGFLYGITEFYTNPRLTGIAWSTVIALLLLGTGLMVARPDQGPVTQLLRDDPGGVLLRRLIPSVIFVPLVLGFLRVQGEQRGWYGTAAGTGTLTIVIVVGFLFILWRTAAVLSHTAEEKAKAEAELRKSEERLRLAWQATREVIWDWDITADAQRWSGAGAEVFGWTDAIKAPQTAAWWTDRVHSEDRGRVAQSFHRVLDNPALQQWQDEYRFLRSDGTIANVLDRGFVVRDEAGRPRRMVGAMLDITERKRTEAALEAARQSSERERNLLQAVMNGASNSHLVYLDREFNFVSVNETYARACGYAPPEMIGLNHFTLYPHAENEEIFKRVRDTGQPASFHDKPFEFPDDPERGVTYWDWTLTPVQAPTGKVEGLIFSLYETTDRKRAEEELRRSEARLAQAVRVAGLGTFEHDHRTDVIVYSPIMRELLGFKQDEAITIAATLAKVAPDDRERLAASIRQAHDPEGNGLFAVDYRVGHSPEGVRWVSARSQTFFEGEGKARRPLRTIGATLDVTERRQAQTNLERLVAERTAKLQELVGELEHFSYTITHDMRAPLRAMRGFGELVCDLCASCEHHERKEFLRKITTSAGRMDCLITDALNYSLSVRQELPMEEVDTGELLRGMLDSYPELQASRAHIRVDSELPVVLGNQAGLTQCFSNLLGNAVKFAKPGRRPEIRIWAEALADCPPLKSEGEWVRMWVEDNGIGIAREMLPRVFDMFSRGSNRYEGTGIGLALVRKVAQRMGGRVGVESEEGQGSRFWLELRVGEKQRSLKAKE